MNALLMSFSTAMYGALTTTKDKIPSDMRAIIKYVVTKWLETQTHSDRQLA